MVRTILGVVAGFVTWLFGWFGFEKIFSGLWPSWYGAQQAAFQAVLVDGGQFSAETSFLLTHIVCGSLVSLLSGYFAARIAQGNARAPLILGLLLTAVGVMKMVMSWPYVPIWYHVAFTLQLFAMTIAGGKLGRARGGVSADKGRDESRR
jgi:hypothetical protein